QPGQRLGSLDALARAAAIRPGSDLRNLAITCLALPELRVAPPGTGPADEPALAVHSARLGADPRGAPRVGPRDGQGLARLPSTRGKVEYCLKSNDGKYVAVRHADRPGAPAFVVWDWQARRPVLEAHQGPSTLFGFASDGAQFFHTPAGDATLVRDLPS